MGKFIIEQTREGFTYSLKAANGEVIATGEEPYISIATAKDRVRSVMGCASEALVEDRTIEGYITKKNPKFEIYRDKPKEFRFRLRSRNGQIIAVSGSYTAKANCKNGIESVRKNSLRAPVIAPEEP